MTAQETITALVNSQQAHREAAKAAQLEAQLLRTQSEEASRRLDEEREKANAQAGQVQRILIAIAHRGEGILVEPSNRLRDCRLHTAFAEVSIYARKTGRGDPEIVELRVSETHHVPGVYKSPAAPWLSFNKGTSDPDKLDRQYDEAIKTAVAWLAPYTAEAVLEAAGIDPATCPEALSLVEIEVGISDGGYGTGRYWHPKWTLACHGVELASLSDLWEISDFENADKPYEERRQLRVEIGNSLPPTPERITPEALVEHQRLIVQWGWAHLNTARQLLFRQAGL